MARTRRLGFQAGIAGALLASTLAAQAGHGSISAFGDPDALPKPGRTPDQADYAEDRIEESARLEATTEAYPRYALCQEIAHEKLAELVFMVRADDEAAAQVALAEYTHYVALAWEALNAITMKSAPYIAGHFFNSLLEHQYVASLNYVDAPAPRALLKDLDALASDYQQRTLPLTPPDFVATTLAKQDEVRLSWEFADRDPVGDW